MADIKIPSGAAAREPGALHRPGRAWALRGRRRTGARAGTGTGRLAALLVSPTLMVLTIVVL